MKASMVFLRKRVADEVPNDDEAIFMASPDNIGYDATGRKTARVTVKNEDEKRKVEIHSSDFFDTEITFEMALAAGAGRDEWQECSRRILENTGVLGRYRAFEKDPNPFFV